MARPAWFSRSLRANPAYTLVPLERLDDGRRSSLGSLGDERDLYGVLIRGGNIEHPPVAVGCDTALLWWTLQSPGPVPSHVERRLGADTEQAIVALIADGLLEIELEGAFVSGPPALAMLQPALQCSTRGALRKLSRTAIELAAALPTSEPERLARFLYRYNSLPCTAALRTAERTGDAQPWAAVIERVSRRAAFAGFTHHADLSSTWCFWSRRGNVATASHTVAHKLYISPSLQALPAAIDLTVDVLCTSGAHQFKVGRRLVDLVRPDKLVAYFGSLETLRRAASQLASALGCQAAQGVPFTAPIDDRGMLSWGLDPPSELPWQVEGSYRYWIVTRLAAALASAKRSGATDYAQFSVERLRLEGVDTTTWTPSSGLFQLTPEMSS